MCGAAHVTWNWIVSSSRRRLRVVVDVDIEVHKAAVPFKSLVRETHAINSRGKFLCPFHDDHDPSCHAFPDGFYCFVCHTHGDHLTWLQKVHGLTFDEALQELRHRASGTQQPSVPISLKNVGKRARTFKPVAPHVVENHRQRAARLDYVPTSMNNRGFTLQDLQHLEFAAEGNNAIFPIPGPDGTVLALKLRLANAADSQRYRYRPTGHGSPAWCSPGFSQQNTVLIIEGELNGMACYLAAPYLAVMGVAGACGRLHTDVFGGRTVYVYADGDDAGQKARNKWAEIALREGAAKVVKLEPWQADACDIAGSRGRGALASLLAEIIRSESFETTDDDPNTDRPGRRKPDLSYSVGHLFPHSRIRDE
jgi:DNA primase